MPGIFSGRACFKHANVGVMQSFLKYSQHWKSPIGWRNRMLILDLFFGRDVLRLLSGCQLRNQRIVDVVRTIEQIHGVVVIAG